MAEYIEKRLALEELENLRQKCEMHDDCGELIARKCKKAVSLLPAADVAPVVHGEWEWFDEKIGTPIDGYDRDWGWRCSVCKDVLCDEYDDPDKKPKMKYCSACGAKMDGGE